MGGDKITIRDMGYVYARWVMRKRKERKKKL